MHFLWQEVQIARMDGKLEFLILKLFVALYSPKTTLYFEAGPPQELEPSINAQINRQYLVCHVIKFPTHFFSHPLISSLPKNFPFTSDIYSNFYFWWMNFISYSKKWKEKITEEKVCDDWRFFFFSFFVFFSFLCL